MPEQNRPSLGTQFAQRFQEARRELRQAPRVGARDLPRLIGLNPNGSASVPIENVYAEATRMLADSGKVFVHGDYVAIEIGAADTLSLQRLATGCDVAPTASALLANYMTCETASESPTFFSPPRNFVSTLLARRPTREALPRIMTYARRPVYDEKFVLQGPGYNAEQGILVHGLDIEPMLPGDVDIRRPILARLPTRLRTLLSGFCFREEADVANGLAALLTGALANHFVRQPKASFLIDANQPGVGKTWLALATGDVLDGELPDLIHYTADDEELAKRILSNLRQRPSSVLIVDNAKNRGGAEISSPCVEANSMAPNITLRILGKSVNYTQPNDLLWFLTMNQTKVSPDLASRGMPIRLYFEGDPATRVFKGPNPLEFALTYRAEILGELFGLVELWKSRGRPLGTRRHRCEYWAQMIGGILEVCGFPEFLANAAEASAAFNTELGELAALAETVVRTRIMPAFGMVAQPTTGESMPDRSKTPAGTGLPAGEWLNIFRSAKVEVERLDAAKSAQGRATIVGSFLARMVGREVPIEVDGRPGKATLRKAQGRSNKQLYYFEVVFDDGQSGPDDRSGGDPQPMGGKAVATGKRARKEPTQGRDVGSRDNPMDRSPASGMVTTGNDEAW